nr:hypothetical protein [uncultured Rhodopila sp.]
MFSSTILDVAAGLIFTFLIVSLAAGAIVEAINSFFKLRSVSLIAGIKQLFNDPKFEKLALTLYQHASINPRGPGAPQAAQPAEVSSAVKKAAKKLAPAYIDPKQFASALIDILGLSAASQTVDKPGTEAIATFTKAINDATTGAPPQIRNFLIGIVQRTKGDLDAIQAELGRWFDSSMDRLSGAFKRWTQLASVVVALTLSVVLNIDSIAVTRVLWAQPKLADQLKISPGLDKELQDTAADPKQLAANEGLVFDQLKTFNQQLPIGWLDGHFLQIRNPAMRISGNPSPDCKISDDAGCFDWFWNDRQTGWWSRPAGWLITALAALFGAPFWFDLLQGFVRLKGAGPSPQEKKDGTAASG